MGSLADAEVSAWKNLVTRGLNMLERRSFALGDSIVVAVMSLVLCLAFAVSAADAKHAKAAKRTVSTPVRISQGDAAIMPVSSISGGPLTWHNDLTKSLGAAGRNNKLVLIDFYTDWCGWCKKLDRDTYTDPNVISFLNDDFVCVKLDAEDGGQGQAAAKKYAVRGFPAIIVLEPSGKLVGAFYGYKNAQDFPAAVKELTGR
jgi:thiol:disulfide interchange protein